MRGETVQQVWKRSAAGLMALGIPAAALAAIAPSGGPTALSMATSIPAKTVPMTLLTSAVRTTDTSASTNWSGYASADKSVHGIEATWRVPAVARHTPTRYSATWVGVDGFNGIKTLIQCGTAQDSNGVYYPWYEMLPAYEQQIKLKVEPGNLITAQVANLGGEHWSMSLVNHSRHWTWSKKVVYSSPGQTTEVIEESPEVRGVIGPVADFGSVSFTGVLMKFPAGDFATGNYGPSQKIDLVTGGRRPTIEATPSSLSYSGGQAFSVRYNG